MSMHIDISHFISFKIFKCISDVINLEVHPLDESYPVALKKLLAKASQEWDAKPLNFTSFYTVAGSEFRRVPLVGTGKLSGNIAFPKQVTQL